MDGSGIDGVLQDAVERGAVPHVAAIVADRDGVLHEGGAGPRAVHEDAATVDAGTQFRVMSMTKMVATVAALQQMERGELDLAAPVTEYRPEFGQIQVLEGWDGDTPRLRPPRTPATVHHLVTHTSGLGYWFWNEQLVRYQDATGLPTVLGGARALMAPMVADPGTAFVYGIGTDWLGKVVEAVAGRSLDVVVEEHVTGPLGMDDTMFLLDDVRRQNCVALHVRGADGGWRAIGEPLPQQPEWWAAGHGLYSTPRDYVRFQRALLRDGELDGTRILRPETVDAAFRSQIGDIPFPEVIPTADPATTDSLRLGPGWTWGHGLLVNTVDLPGRRRAGSGAWAGLFNTHFWIDRAAGICGSIYTNSLPFIPERDAWRTYVEFEQAVYAAS